MALPIVRDTVSFEPGGVERRGPARTTRVDRRLLHASTGSTPRVVRGGAVAVAALALVPLAVLALRRRWAALVIGGTVAVLALLLVPQLFTRSPTRVSLSQSRRLASFLPLAFALAGGIAVARAAPAPRVVPVGARRRRRPRAAWPGDFGRRAAPAEPGVVAWFALVGGAVGARASRSRARADAVRASGRAAFVATLVVPLPARCTGSRAGRTAARRDAAR